MGKYKEYDIKPKNTEKRERVILYQLLSDIMTDVCEICKTHNKKDAHKEIDYKIDNMFKLREKAYDLLDKQDIYTEQDVYNRFESAHIMMREFVKKLR